MSGPGPGSADGAVRVITCQLPEGVGRDLARRLFQELGLTRVDVHTARGFMGSDPRGLFNRVEKDVLVVVVEAAEADRIFEWIWREAGVGEHEGRFLYQARLSKSTPFTLPPEVPLEEPA